MNDDPRRGLGLYQGLPTPIPDDLRPGMPPQPSTGQPGPDISVALPGEEFKEYMDKVDQVGRTLSQIGFDFIAANAMGQTDGSGNCVIVLYQVAAGDESRLHRLTMNAINPSTNASYTPASPYTNASTAYVKLFEAEGTSNITADLGHSGLLDFGPPTATGPVFPGNFEWTFEQAPFVRGPNAYILQVVAGPANASVYCRYQMSKRRMKGLA